MATCATDQRILLHVILEYSSDAPGESFGRLDSPQGKLAPEVEQVDPYGGYLGAGGGLPDRTIELRLKRVEVEKTRLHIVSIRIRNDRTAQIFVNRFGKSRCERSWRRVVIMSSRESASGSEVRRADQTVFDIHLNGHGRGQENQGNSVRMMNESRPCLHSLEQLICFYTQSLSALRRERVITSECGSYYHSHESGSG